MLVGASRHRHRPFSRLASPTFDLVGLHAALTAPELGGFAAAPPRIDQPAFDLNMELESFFREREPEAQLLLYLAGHVLVDEQGALALLTYGTERGRWRSSIIDFGFVRDVMDQCSAERQVLILDARIGALGPGPLGAPVDLDAALGGSRRVVLAASNRVGFRLEGDAVTGDASAAPLAQRLVQGLRSGDADVDGDGRISVADLARHIGGGAPASAALGAIVIAHRASQALGPAAPIERPSRPNVPRRRSWASHAASSVASWFAEHVGL
ncbi:MAG TPA: hypothetical protein VMG12_28135 [Polyangiaceae bacterium]|nr:hypothetical protein [Polyangiaceae bacterium]